MRRSPPPSSVVRRLSRSQLALALMVLILVALGAPRAEARIGIPKKVKDVVSKPAEPKAAPAEPVVFDEVTLELNEERVNAMLAACKRVEKVSAGRSPIVEKWSKAEEERAKFLEKHDEKIREVRNKRSEIEVCRADGYHAAQDRRMQEYSQRALTDPALLDRFGKIAAQYNAAAMAGDTAAVRAAQEAMGKEILPTQEDSTNVNRECGPIPPLSAEEKKLDALDKEVASLQEQIRAIDDKIVAEQTSAGGGFTREQWGMAVERIQMFLYAKRLKPEDAPRGFSGEEIKAMEKHLEELKGATCWT